MKNYLISVLFLFATIFGQNYVSFASEYLMQNMPKLNPEQMSTIRDQLGVKSFRQLSDSSVQIWDVPNKSQNEVMSKVFDKGISISEMLGDYRNVFSRPPSNADIGASAQKILDNIVRKNSADKVEVFSLTPATVLNFALTKGFDSRDGFETSESINISLTKNLVATAKKEAVRITKNGYVWRGKVEGEGGEVLLISDGGTLTGTVNANGIIYSIRPIGGSLHAVVEKNVKDLPQEHPPSLREKAKKKKTLDRRGSNRDARNNENQSVNIDILVAYTKAAAENFVDIERDLINVAMEESNQSFSDSLLGHIKLTLVHSVEVEYTESSVWDNHLKKLVNSSDGVMDDVHRLRDEKKADIVVLIIDDKSWCGEAEEIGASKEQAFAIVYHDCATGYYSFGHEIGHLLGARHDECVDDDETPYKFGHGFLQGTAWRTIMGYGRCCASCNRRPYWSNPNLTVDGAMAGTTAINDNARVWNIEASSVSSFR